MNAKAIYAQMEKDFITSAMSDDWMRHMDDIGKYLCANFKDRSMGLVCDFASEITHVYTAVFPSEQVLKKILAEGKKDALLFVHHPSVWDIRRNPPFYNMDTALLDALCAQHIAIYNLHVPLDAYTPYGTSVNLAQKLGLTISEPFAPYFGVMAGVIATSALSTISDLKNAYAQAVGHDVVIYAYGVNDALYDQRIAVVAGGGLTETIREVYAAGATVFVNGITARSSYSKEAHDFAKEHGITILGGTHYSTEKFACQKMVKYFNSMGLSAVFIDDEPVMEDM